MDRSPEPAPRRQRGVAGDERALVLEGVKGHLEPFEGELVGRPDVACRPRQAADNRAIVVCSDSGGMDEPEKMLTVTPQRVDAAGLLELVAERGPRSGRLLGPGQRGVEEQAVEPL